MKLTILGKPKNFEQYESKVVYHSHNKYILDFEEPNDIVKFLKENLENLKVVSGNDLIEPKKYIQQFVEKVVYYSDFDIAYQKIFDRDFNVIGAEFFCKFPIYPPLIADIMEDTTLLDFKCLKKVLERVNIKKWNKKIFFNLFTQSLRRFDFIASLISAVRKEYYPEKFVIEVLENALDLKDSAPIFKLLKKYKINIAIDDWGSETAGIDRIVRLNPDYVKIDKSITWNPKAFEITKPLIKKLSMIMGTIVEGIETKEHLKEAYPVAKYFQGYLLHKPEKF
jgi:EAL domain-containing protein (putative c-di-GMP-specific phosphodiesterase class I)